MANKENKTKDKLFQFKRALLTYSLLVLFFGSSFGQDQLTLKDFQNLCDSTGLHFNMPKGYEIIDVTNNNDLHYHFAVINQDSTMEIRYSFWSLQSAVEQYKESLTDDNSIMISPNKIYKGRAQTNVLNMTGGQNFGTGPFPPQAVKHEFNADAGGSSFFEFNCDFGKGYKYGQAMYLHKDDVADVIVTFLSNDKKTHSDLMTIGFHSLTFKKD